MTVIRYIAIASFVQCVMASAAFAGNPVDVPEPASLTLLALGMGGVALARKLRKRK